MFGFLLACGSPGGLPHSSSKEASNEGNVADVSLNVFPQKIDSGDAFTLTIRLSDVQDIFQLKIRTHRSLKYVEYSAVFVPDEDKLSSVEIDSDFYLSDDYSYTVVNFEDTSMFGKNRSGSLSLMIEALKPIKTQFAVDVDRITTVDNGDFNPNRPGFTELASVGVIVE